MLISPIEGMNHVASRPQPGVPVNKLLSAGGRDSVEAAGRDLPDGLGDSLVVTHGHQKEEFGH